MGNNVTLGDRFSRAFQLALELHRNQYRKGANTPYMGHLMGCAALVLESQGDETEACAALLHDAAEDQGGRETLCRIAKEIGEDVARIVEACSDCLEQPKPAWRPRKERYLEHLSTADASIRLVSLADKVYNAESIVDAASKLGLQIYDRFTARREGTLWYYKSVLQILQAHPLPREEALLKRLSRACSLMP